MTLILSTFELYSQVVDFFREDLSFKLNKEYFVVDGNYYFRNNSSLPITKIMIYPFPEDSLLGNVSAITCFNIADSISATKKIFDSKITFTITIPANNIAIYKIGYRQDLLGSMAKYILTTTHQWKKPFEQASYTLIAKNINIDSLSYIPDRVESFQDSTIFLWNKKNFMPNMDFEVFFQRLQ